MNNKNAHRQTPPLPTSPPLSMYAGSYGPAPLAPTGHADARAVAGFFEHDDRDSGQTRFTPPMRNDPFLFKVKAVRFFRVGRGRLALGRFRTQARSRAACACFFGWSSRTALCGAPADGRLVVAMIDTMCDMPAHTIRHKLSTVAHRTHCKRVATHETLHTHPCDSSLCYNDLAHQSLHVFSVQISLPSVRACKQQNLWKYKSAYVRMGAITFIYMSTGLTDSGHPLIRSADDACADIISVGSLLDIIWRASTTAAGICFVVGRYMAALCWSSFLIDMIRSLSSSVASSLQRWCLPWYALTRM